MGAVSVVVVDVVGDELFEVGSDQGAVSAFRLVRFPGPPSEPDVRLSPHPALHQTRQLTVLEHPVPQYLPRAEARFGSSVFTVDFYHAGLLLLSGCPPSPCDRLSRPRTTTRTPPRHGAIG